jgi:hypothetical protein
MRRFVLTLLFVVLIVSLNRDETWALPSLSDKPLTESQLEEIIDQYLDRLTITRVVPVCDCAGHQVTILETFVEAEEWTPRRTISADQCDCASGQQVESGRRLAAEKTLFPRRCYGGMMSTNLEVIWEMSV